MTFTYVLTTDVGLVRLEIGDTTAGAGVKPDGTNLTDEEIGVWLSRESNDVMRAAACACEALARMWAPMADISVGPRRESLSQVAAGWSKQAAALRAQFGGNSLTFSASFDRVDGYSANADTSSGQG